MIVLIIDDKMDMIIVLCLEGRYAGIKDDTHSRSIFTVYCDYCELLSVALRIHLG